jgi:hypothetical protein
MDKDVPLNPALRKEMLLTALYLLEKPIDVTQDVADAHMMIQAIWQAFEFDQPIALHALERLAAHRTELAIQQAADSSLDDPEWGSDGIVH